MSATRQLERKIVRELIRFMAGKGFTVHSVFDGGDTHKPKTEAAALAYDVSVSTVLLETHKEFSCG